MPFKYWYVLSPQVLYLTVIFNNDKDIKFRLIFSSSSPRVLNKNSCCNLWQINYLHYHRQFWDHVNITCTQAHILTKAMMRHFWYCLELDNYNYVSTYCLELIIYMIMGNNLSTSALLLAFPFVQSRYIFSNTDSLLLDMSTKHSTVIQRGKAFREKQIKWYFDSVHNLSTWYDQCEYLQ